MTDIELIRKAYTLNDEDWNGVYKLAKQAQSEEARRELERLARSYYRNEEYRNGDS